MSTALTTLAQPLPLFISKNTGAGSPAVNKHAWQHYNRVHNSCTSLQHLQTPQHIHTPCKAIPPCKAIHSADLTQQSNQACLLLSKQKKTTTSRQQGWLALHHSTTTAAVKLQTLQTIQQHQQGHHPPSNAIPVQDSTCSSMYKAYLLLLHHKPAHKRVLAYHHW